MAFYGQPDPSIRYAPSQQPPVMQQPAPMMMQQTGPMMQSNNNTVVINNAGQQGVQQNQARRWSTGRCDCFNDLGSCCLVYWLGDLYGMCWVNKINESCCLPFCCPESWLGATRTKIRTKYNIEGSILSDLCLTSPCCLCCCRPLIFCQMVREVDIMTKKGFPMV